MSAERRTRPRWLDGDALMREIDRSVLTWCSDHKPEDAVFHGAVLDPEAPTREELDLGWRNYWHMHGREATSLSKIVFRCPTWSHVPLDYGWRASPARRSAASGLPFQPFEHYRYVRGRPRCVLRSNWIGLPRGGRFRTPHDPQGRLTEELGRMIVLMVDRYAMRPNWSGYTNLDIMKADARMALVTGLLKFSPLKSSNPFAYATRTMQTAFINSKNAAAATWEQERLLGYCAMISDTGEELRPETQTAESHAAAAERELIDGQRAFDGRK